MLGFQVRNRVDNRNNSSVPPPKYNIRTVYSTNLFHSRIRHQRTRGNKPQEMKLNTSFLFALASVSDAKKGGKKNKEKEHWVIVSGKERAFGEHCLAEQNEDGILTMTTTIGLNEVASCHRQLGCRDGYTLHRNIASINGLQDCWGCEDDDETGPLCHNNYDHNSFKFKYRIRLPNRYC